MIKETKIFMNGQSQAVRLPKACRFAAKTVYVNKIGNYVILVPKQDPWDGMIQACGAFTDDFMTVRDQPPVQERERLG